MSFLSYLMTGDAAVKLTGSWGMFSNSGNEPLKSVMDEVLPRRPSADSTPLYLALWVSAIVYMGNDLCRRVLKKQSLETCYGIEPLKLWYRWGSDPKIQDRECCVMVSPVARQRNRRWACRVQTYLYISGVRVDWPCLFNRIWFNRRKHSSYVAMSHKILDQVLPFANTLFLDEGLWCHQCTSSLRASGGKI